MDKLLIMGQSYNYLTPVQSFCNTGSGYVNIGSFAPDAFSPRYLSPTSINMVPPKGTICQILGLTHTEVVGTLNKLNVEISDYRDCLSNFPSIPLVPKRLFCAKFTEGGQAQLALEGKDHLAPIYCPPWEGSLPPKMKHSFWPFGKGDEDEDEDEEGEDDNLIFVGFFSEHKPNTADPILFESWPCIE